MWHFKALLPEHAHLSQTDGTLLGCHVASAWVGLWQLSYVILTIWFSFTFWKVRPSERAQRLFFFPQRLWSNKKNKKIPHKNLTLSTARWCRQACSCWGTSPASASWLHGSCPQERPSGCCRLGTRSHGSGGQSQSSNKRPLGVIWGLISAFTLNTHHWTIKSQAVIIWALQTQSHWKWDPCRVMWPQGANRQLFSQVLFASRRRQFEGKS